MKILKTVCLLGLAIVLFVACKKQEKRYTQQSSEIETVKKHIDNYNSKNYDISVFADTSKTYFNTKDNPILSKDIIAFHKTNDANYSSRGFTNEDPDYEMVITDDGDTWVNCWLNWKATLVGNGKEINIPIHLTYQFVDGKIVKELGYWDGTEVAMNLQAIEAQKNNSESEEKN